MAEELEKTQEPKTELIKRRPVEKIEKNEREEDKSIHGEKTGENERTEHRKVIVVKKKPLTKKPQPKIVVMAANVVAPIVDEPASEKLKHSQEAVKTDKGEESERIPEKVKPESVEKPTETPPVVENTVKVDPKAVRVFQIKERPHVIAGKVGGRNVGPKPHQENKSHQRNRNNERQTGQHPAHRQNRWGSVLSGAAQERGGKPDFSSGNVRNNGPHNSPRYPRQQGVSDNRQGRNFGGQRPPRPLVTRIASGIIPQSPPSSDAKPPAKRSFKAKKTVYTRKEKEVEMEEKLHSVKKKIIHSANPVPKTIEIMEVVSVAELAKKMNLRAADLIAKLLSMGQLVSINQQIDADTARLLALEYGADVKIVSLFDETVIETKVDETVDMTSRPPVVTVMGHVDHGKTKLLDAIRSSDVIAGEFGGITQHIGAYMVETARGRITFLDTPGHEAFTRMRARGAQVTDIVVLVVAADDGVMPQTIEAINHAKEANVPIIVAINKIDKLNANVDRVKTQLSEFGLQPEEWGGQTMFVEISALKKLGLDKLIESILLEAEIQELRTNYHRNAEAKVLESRIDHGRGTVATVIIEKGTLKIGNSFVAGIWPGRVRALFNDKGIRVKEATPAMPVEVIGFDGGIPNAGDPFQVVEDEKFARGISAKRRELKRIEDAKSVKKITLENLHDTISEGDIQELKVIVKADVQGSAEALRSSLEKLSTKEVRLNVIQALPGAINEGDVELAAASKAIIIGFNVRPVPKAKILADQEKVDIRKYNIIFKATEEIQQAMEGMLKPDMKEEVIATVEVRNTFKTPKFGVVAGCYVLSGTIKRSASTHVIRDNVELYSGKIASLRRFKDDVKEVATGFECGLGIEGFDGVQVGDQLEIFEMIEVARKLVPTRSEKHESL
ncbi:MAG: translation initiation factor IF-2 [Treponema sp.]|jgi:translation initiation factor IF-2|nr:translation initiation factor IF-2 [Treponema sp.]